MVLDLLERERERERERELEVGLGLNIFEGLLSLLLSAQKLRINQIIFDLK